PDGAEDDGLERVVVEVGGKRLEVVMPAGLGVSSNGTRSKSSRKPLRRGSSRSSGAAPGGNSLASPMQGTIVKVAVNDGDELAEGDLVVVLEAMKMEQPLVAHRAGTVKGLAAAVGDTVSSGSVICQIESAQSRARPLPFHPHPLRWRPLCPAGVRVRLKSMSGEQWVRCRCGQRHWGAYGAAGLLLLDQVPATSAVVQHRAGWTHFGGYWGIP